MALTTGSRLGPYEIVAPLGAGGMGEVYRARDSRLGREVAVKVLPGHLSGDPALKARFEREARTVSQLNHPNICVLHDIGRDADVDYLVMELVEGETLAHRLEKGPLPLPEALRVGAQIAEALDRAHRAGVVHRDLKPGNIMLARGAAKLMDFGLARHGALRAAPGDLTTSPTVAQPLTSEGSIVGTFQYMAPEQLEAREADARSDLWALGCVLYEMATGRRAFDGKSQASLISSIMSSPLKNIPEFYDVSCPQCGADAHRETDTFDTFMESSWYYARYCCYNQDTAMLDDRAKYWTPVDQYIGGIEHAIMHLLYARFMHKLLRDEGLVNSDEPFTNLLTQGMVLKDGAKMSKSKGNTVSPDELIQQYGADTVRLFIIFASPPENSLEWSDSGVEGAHKFLKRLWTYAYTHKDLFISLNQSDQDRYDFSEAENTIKQMRKELHSILNQVNHDIERLQYNTIVSASMKIFNLLTELNVDDEMQSELIHEAFSILLSILTPITPHICHTLWRELEFGKDVSLEKWPKVDSKALKTDLIMLVVQINGKKRGEINVPSDADDQMVTDIVLNDEKIKPLVTTPQSYKKIIVVPKRLVNIVV